MSELLKEFRVNPLDSDALNHVRMLGIMWECRAFNLLGIRGNPKFAVGETDRRTGELVARVYGTPPLDSKP